MQDQNLKKFITDIERDLLLKLILNMKHKEISIKKAKTLAREFLELLPPENKRIFINKLSELGKKYREIQELYLKYAPVFNEERKNEVTGIVQNLIKNGDIDNAIKLLKEETYGR